MPFIFEKTLSTVVSIFFAAAGSTFFRTTTKIEKRITTSRTYETKIENTLLFFFEFEEFLFFW